ncbi:MAG TPA: hypothetical protein DCK98_11540 [Chloroflexi bacterium]|nr:hypothetical protein [Chloroflexota bacterium]HAL28145.1 hypothetical protein [Chloroflexota bacterium]
MAPLGAGFGGLSRQTPDLLLDLGADGELRSDVLAARALFADPGGNQLAVILNWCIGHIGPPPSSDGYLTRISFAFEAGPVGP